LVPAWPWDPNRCCQGSADLIGSDLPKFENLAGRASLSRHHHAELLRTLLVDSTGVALAPFGFLNPVAAGFICVAFELGFHPQLHKKITASIG
jgi:hypothetical protein